MRARAHNPETALFYKSWLFVRRIQRRQNICGTSVADVNSLTLFEAQSWVW